MSLLRPARRDVMRLSQAGLKRCGGLAPVTQVTHPKMQSMGAFQRRLGAIIEREDAMATLAVQLTIGDYAKWRPVFDKHKPLRDKAGMRNVRVYRDADNPKEIIVWGETGDAAKARAALGGDEIKNAMKEAGVVGPPKIHVID